MLDRLLVRESLANVRPIILVIDDDPQIRRFINFGLELHGYAVREAGSGADGLSTAAHIRPDLIVLDLRLPDMSGIEVLRSIRSWSRVPIIVLSIEAAQEQKALLLKTGADDYIVKPFDITELAARCEATLRCCHWGAGHNNIVRTGQLCVDLVSHNVTLNGKAITLTRKEYQLLEILASNLGLVVMHNQLINEIWCTSFADEVADRVPPIYLQYLRMLARRLRAKIEADPNQPKLLVSDIGVGYRLQAISETDAG